MFVGASVCMWARVSVFMCVFVCVWCVSVCVNVCCVSVRMCSCVFVLFVYACEECECVFV